MVKKEVTCSVNIFGSKFPVDYTIGNWSEELAELIDVFGELSVIIDEYQTLKMHHSTHGYVRRTCERKIYEAARKNSPAVLEKRERQNEDGSTAVIEFETAESIRSYKEAAQAVAEEVLKVLPRFEVDFGRGSRDPRNEDLEDAEKYIGLFLEDPAKYQQVLDRASSLKIRMPATPDVESLANYLRQLDLARKEQAKANPMAKFV